MSQDNRVYVIGNSRVTTDSVVSAIGYAAYANETGMDAVPCRLGDINSETKYLLNRFHFEAPMLLETARVNMGEIDLDPPVSTGPDATIMEAVRTMDESDRESLAIVDGEGKMIGWISKTDISRVAISDTIHSTDMLVGTPAGNFAKTVRGEVVYEAKGRKVNGKVSIITNTDKDGLDRYEVRDRIVIVGSSKKAQLAMIEKGAAMIVVIWTEKIASKVIDEAKEYGCTVIRSGYGAMNTSRYIFFAPPIRNIMKTKIYTFHAREIVEDCARKMAKSRFRSYPVIDEKGHLLGYASRIQIMNYHNKRVVMVDHNEFSKSVPGIEKADVIEVIDHHRVADFSTRRPVSFRNELVGSTSTIIATIFRENQVPIPENLAGLLLGGILSDTTNLRTPSTTRRDRETATILAAIANISLEEFAEDFFSNDDSSQGKSFEELIAHDILYDDVAGIRCMYGKVNVPNAENYIKDADEIQRKLDEFVEKRGLDLGIMSFTSILEEGSVLFFSGSKAEWGRMAYPSRPGETNSFHKGVTSRTVQIIPKIHEIIEKYG